MKPSLLLLLPCAFVAQSAHASALLKPASGVSVALAPKFLSLDAHLHGAFAQTTVTTVFANPNQTQIEADFIYSAPKDSVVTGFAYWYQGEKVQARIVEKGRAAKIYSYITSRMRDPALIEMIGPNRFRARIFPIEARTDLKIEVQLAQHLAQTPSGPVWTWPLREETKANRLAQLSLRVQSDGKTPIQSNFGKVQNGELSIQKTNFRASGDARVLIPQPKAPLRASLIGARDGGPDGFFALSLSSSTPVASPRFSVSGISTYDVLVPTARRLGANMPLVVVGRYRGHGEATVSLNGRRVGVNFPDARENRNVPELLWASARMEALSAQPKNRDKVTAMSLRFEMPTKWTSWLAIPEEERRQFKQQMLASDRAEAARAYAQAVSRGDESAQKAQKVVFDELTTKLKALGETYSSNEELQPLDSYLNDELRRLQSAVLQAKYDPKIPRSQSAQWTRWAKNLEHAGAKSDGKGVDLPVYVVEDELKIASRLYLIEVEAGRKNGAQARKMQARLQELAATKTAKQYGWGADEYLNEEAGARANALAMEIATNRAADKPNKARERAAQASLIRLNGIGGVDSSNSLQGALQQVWGQKIEGAATRYAGEIEAGRVGSDAAQKYAREIRILQEKSGLKEIPRLQQAWLNFASKTGTSLAPSIAEQGVDGNASKQLDAQVAQIAKQSDEKPADLRAYAWYGVEQELSRRLQQEITGNDESDKARQLEAQLREVAQTKSTGSADSLIQSSWRNAAEETARKLAQEVSNGREESAIARSLEQRLDRQKKRAGNYFYGWGLQRAYMERASRIADQLVQHVAEHGQLPADAKELRAQGEKFAAKSYQGGNFDAVLLAKAGPQLTILNRQLAEEVALKREDGAKAVELRAKIAKTEELLPGAKPQPYRGYNSSREGQNDEQFAWEARAHEAAYRLLQAQKGESTDAAQIQSLKAELAVSAKSAGKNASDVSNWEATRLAKNEPLVTANDYRLRPGDPLIAVKAPANCRRVVALMPDGTLLPLEWNARTSSFEARFDVPAFAPEGDYAVKIILIGEDGTRRILTMRFAVDLKSPHGEGVVACNGKTWHLALRADALTDRVSAFTPWNARVELKRGEGDLFCADTLAPDEWQNKQGATRFVVTDGAHNRTEVVVDPR